MNNTENTTKLEEIKKVEASVKKMDDFTDPEKLHQELLAGIRKYHPSADLSMIEKAYQVAAEAHKDQKRKSGEPYIIHPLCVGIILADLEMDKETIAAGLLHDVVEDTVMTYDEIKDEFGEEVAQLVDGVTKLGQLSYSADKVEVQAENLRKMFLAMAKDIRVIIIKLADRLHNMRTLKYMRPEKQKEKARETMDIYAPIAQRLGISKIKVELDDLSLKYLQPDVYYDLVEKIALRKAEREKFVQGIVDEVKRHIDEAGIKAQVDGRVKHFFSIYKKMVNQDKTLDQIYDLFAVRIIVDTVKDCYAALGVIHEMYTPIPGRFKDYIAMPKPNMYQSLHTTLIGPNGTPFEIQIRTFEMHRTAEYGIAAHWKYKEQSDGKKSSGNQEEAKMTWLRQILEWQRDMSDNREFMNLLKSDLDLFAENVYCFTPAGDVKNLPAGSTPIDFAYSIHSAIGNSMVGATVNGRIVNFDYVLQNGDIVDIRTSKNAPGPSRDWLNLAKSGAARTKIKQWFKKERREENIVHGKEQFERELRANGIAPADIMGDEILPLILKRLAFTSLDDLYAAIGYGGVTATRTVNRIRDEILRNQKANQKNAIDRINEAAERRNKRPRHAVHGILVEGLDNCLIKFSRCCTPVPGDSIIGFITRGAGVSIHRTDCENYLASRDNPETAGRWIRVSWAERTTDAYSTTLMMLSAQRSGLVMDVATALNTLNAKVRTLTARDVDSGRSTITITVEVHDLAELRTIISRLSAIRGVIRISRSGASDPAKAAAHTAELQAEQEKKAKQEGKA